MSTYHIGEIFEQQVLLAEAMAYYNKALDMANFWEYTRGKIQALLKLGKKAEHRKDWPNALTYFQAVSSIHQGMKAVSYYKDDEQRISRVKQNIQNQ